MNCQLGLRNFSTILIGALCLVISCAAATAWSDDGTGGSNDALGDSSSVGGDTSSSSDTSSSGGDSGGGSPLAMDLTSTGPSFGLPTFGSPDSSAGSNSAGSNDQVGVSDIGPPPSQANLYDQAKNLTGIDNSPDLNSNAPATGGQTIAGSQGNIAGNAPAICMEEGPGCRPISNIETGSIDGYAPDPNFQPISTSPAEQVAADNGVLAGLWGGTVGSLAKLAGDAGVILGNGQDPETMAALNSQNPAMADAVNNAVNQQRTAGFQAVNYYTSLDPLLLPSDSNTQQIYNRASGDIGLTMGTLGLVAGGPEVVAGGIAEGGAVVATAETAVTKAQTAIGNLLGATVTASQTGFKVLNHGSNIGTTWNIADKLDGLSN
jgi:hypothetical protein